MRGERWAGVCVKGGLLFCWWMRVDTVAAVRLTSCIICRWWFGLLIFV